MPPAELAVQPSDGLQTVLGFTPDEVLVEEARYTATVVGAVDLVGNVMVEAHEWVFHTGGGSVGGIQSGTAERVRQSYAFGGRPVAVRERVGEVESVYWLHPDHLGSTTLVTDAAGDTAAERRYLPWGEERYVDAEVPTDRLYTGQIKDRYRDTANEWLSWYVHRSTLERYYIPIGPFSSDFRKGQGEEAHILCPGFICTVGRCASCVESVAVARWEIL